MSVRSQARAATEEGQPHPAEVPRFPTPGRDHHALAQTLDADLKRGVFLHRRANEQAVKSAAFARPGGGLRDPRLHTGGAGGADA